MIKRDLVTLGQIQSAYGVQGWLHCLSFCENPDDLFQFQPLLIKSQYGIRELVAEDWSLHKQPGSRPADASKGLSYIVRFEGIDSRDKAEPFVNAKIAVPREALPALASDEVYLRDLEGLTVRNMDDLVFGNLVRIFETGANDVCLVKPTEDSVDDVERLIPYIVGQYVKSVDIDNRSMIVDWEVDW